MDQPVIGVDVGGTNLQFGVVDERNRIVGRARAKTEASGGLTRILENIDTGVRVAAADAGVPLEQIAAIGVAAAGAIDVPRGIILTAPNLALTDTPLRDLVAERTGRVVVLDNDVNAAVWAEHQLGVVDGDTLGVWLGTGVGGGLVLGGRLYHGDAFTAGEIGHTVVLPDGP
ncbi:MAG: ROK family protein, partial [Phycisphaerae bacterium]|nr:ROK family protein [Phycisphaerae bacterium]